MKNPRLFFATVLLSVCVLSCNIYKPFATAGSVEDIVDAARQCLHQGDYACAIAQYNRLPDGDLKSEKLCLTMLAKAGTTMEVLTSIMGQGSSSMLGNLADSLLPWTSTKGEDMASARTSCLAYTNAGASSKTKTLLKMLALTSDCAMRMAKTDTFVANADADTTCNTAGNGDGAITSADIGGDGTGSITTTGMCSADVDECHDDVAALPNSTELGGANLSSFQDAFAAIPADLATSVVTNTNRLGLKATVTP